MSVVKWEDRYSVGIDLVDQHHRYLFELLSRSDIAIRQKRSMVEVRRITLELMDYTDHHLKTEEEMMKKAGYTRVESHVTEHELFLNKLNELKNSLFLSDSGYCMEINHYLEEWLLSHILLLDKDFAEFVKTSSHTDER